jgi:tripartite-type tricarboxylate transporter receptor subunit TctC
MEARIANFGYTAFACSSAEFGKFIAEDIQKWAKVVKFAGIRPD